MTTEHLQYAYGNDRLSVVIEGHRAQVHAHQVERIGGTYLGGKSYGRLVDFADQVERYLESLDYAISRESSQIEQLVPNGVNIRRVLTISACAPPPDAEVVFVGRHTRKEREE